MDVPQWSQQVTTLSSRPMNQDIENTTPPNNINPNNNTNSSRNATPQQQQQQQQQQQVSSLERRALTRPPKDQNINCPRCNSTNTKFCYYNNYSLTQPRFFCKTCRRYWTQGGSLRSVPVGGGSRKNKRSSSSYATSSTPQPQLQPIPLSTSTTTPSLPPLPHNKLLLPGLNPPTSLSHLLTTTQNPNMKFLEGQDLNLAFPVQGLFNHQIDHQLPKIEGNNTKIENYGLPFNINGDISSNNTGSNTNTTAAAATATNTSGPLSALELLRNGFASRGSLNPFIPIPISDSNTLFQSGYPNLQEFKPNMNMFSSPNHHEHDNNNNNNNNHENTNARLLFPFADMNKLASNNQHHDEIDHDQSKGNNDQQHGYWSGMLGGGTWYSN